MSRSPVGRVLERNKEKRSRQRARGSPSRGKKSACLASGRLRGAARTGTLPEFWTPGLSLILGMSTADQISSALHGEAFLTARRPRLKPANDDGSAGMRVSRGLV